MIKLVPHSNSFKYQHDHLLCFIEGKSNTPTMCQISIHIYALDQNEFQSQIDSFFDNYLKYQYRTINIALCTADNRAAKLRELNTNNIYAKAKLLYISI